MPNYTKAFAKPPTGVSQRIDPPSPLNAENPLISSPPSLSLAPYQNSHSPPSASSTPNPPSSLSPHCHDPTPEAPARLEALVIEREGRQEWRQGKECRERVLRVPGVDAAPSAADDLAGCIEDIEDTAWEVRAVATVLLRARGRGLKLVDVVLGLGL